MSKNLHEEPEARVIEDFEAVDLGAPFRVVLKNCITARIDPDTGEMLDYSIPDFEGLVRTVVMGRLVHDRKLSGAELKYLRKATGTKQIDLAHVLDCQPEHLSKVEGGKHPLSPTAEKIARVYLFKVAVRHHKMAEGQEKVLLDNLLDKLFSGLKPVAAFEAEELVLLFYRSAAAPSMGEPANDDSQEGKDSPCAWYDNQLAVAG